VPRPLDAAEVASLGNSNTSADSAAAADTTARVTVLINQAGLELHFFLADRPAFPESTQNILMDFPQEKYPGHTHVCFSVSSVAGVIAYLRDHGIEITGERPPEKVRESTGRPLVAVFCRDPDRLTIEFENTGFSARNAGDVANPDTSASGAGAGAAAAYDLLTDRVRQSQTCDHVGTRTLSVEHTRRWAWYAEMFGFDSVELQYELDATPTKNISPWIAANASGAELNYLPNANMTAAGAHAGERRNVLIDEQGRVLPGILWVGLEVADVSAAAAALAAKGVRTFSDTDVASVQHAEHRSSVATVAFGDAAVGSAIGSDAALARTDSLSLPGKVLPVPAAHGGSVFVMDDDANLWRLVQAASK
jgi:catechol 2,3-dioxygenase-like lactoylglutathione lyase family enzyme